MTEEQKKKYIAKVAMTNYVVCFLAIVKESRLIVTLYLKRDGTLTDRADQAEYFADTRSAFTFLHSAPFECPKVPENFEIIPHSTFYKEVTVELLYNPKNEKGEYTVDMKYTFFGDRDLECVFNANGNTTLRQVVNNQYPVYSGDPTHV